MKKLLVALFLVLTFVSFAFADVTVKLGVTGSVYDEMWQPVKEMLAKEGINLEVIQFTDYVTPNRALADGDIDLNGFQHQIYFKDELESRGYKLTNIANTFVVPLNLYSIKIKTLDEIKDGDVIAKVYLIKDKSLLTFRSAASEESVARRVCWSTSCWVRRLSRWAPASCWMVRSIPLYLTFILHIYLGICRS